MEVAYLRSQGLGDEQIQRLCGLSKATFYRYLGAYQAGGVAKLKELSCHPRGSALNRHRKQCLYSKYYATSADFQKAIQTCIAQAYHQHRAELKSLLTLRFQTFKEVPVIGEGGKVSLFSGANQPQKKVSSKAA